MFAIVSKSVVPFAGSGRDAANCLDELDGIERLDDPSGRAGLPRTVLLCGVALGRQNEDGYRAIARVLADRLDEAEAIELGHVDVGHDDVRHFLRAQHLPTMHAVHGLRNPETGIHQGEIQHVAHGAGIVDGHYDFAHWAASSVEISASPIPRSDIASRNSCEGSTRLKAT